MVGFSLLSSVINSVLSESLSKLNIAALAKVEHFRHSIDL